MAYISQEAIPEKPVPGDLLDKSEQPKEIYDLPNIVVDIPCALLSNTL